MVTLDKCTKYDCNHLYTGKHVTHLQNGRTQVSCKKRCFTIYKTWQNNCKLIADLNRSAARTDEIISITDQALVLDTRKLIFKARKCNGLWLTSRDFQSTWTTPLSIIYFRICNHFNCCTRNISSNVRRANLIWFCLLSEKSSANADPLTSQKLSTHPALGDWLLRLGRSALWITASPVHCNFKEERFLLLFIVSVSLPRCGIQFCDTDN